MKIPLKSGQTLQVMVFTGERTVACDAMVLNLEEGLFSITPPHRHNVRVPVKTSHLVVTLTTSQAAFTMDCQIREQDAEQLLLEIPPEEDIQKMQRREFARVPASGPCTIEPSERQAPRVPGQLKDISGGGCSVQAAHALPKGTRVRVLFDLPQEGTFRLSGQVRRLLTTMTPTGAQHMLGIAFDALPEAERRRLIHYVYQAQLEMARNRKSQERSAH